MTSAILTNGGSNPDNILELYIKTSVSKTCISACSSECITCQTYSDTCTQCRQVALPLITFLLQSEGKCFTQYCPLYFYEDVQNKICARCQDLSLNCKDCFTNYQCTQNGGTLICSSNDLVLCRQCDTGYYSLRDVNNFLSCVNSIPDGFINNINGNLTKCSPQCLTCSYHIQNCLSCTSLNYFNFQCLDQCPFSHYSKKTIISFNSQQIQTLMCQRCQPNCNTCSNSTFCLSCLNNLYLIESTGQCVTFASCPQGTYSNTMNQKCTQCNSPCARCFNLNECKQCLNELILLDKGCVNQCPLGMFSKTIPDVPSLNGQKLTCSGCVYPCQTCIDQSKCLTCKIGAGFLFYENLNQCLEQCPKGYKPDSLGLRCIPCPSNCSACNSSQCTQCMTIQDKQYVMLNGSCIASCPQSYFPQLQQTTQITQCIPCSISCSICQNAKYCTRCKSPYLFFQSNNSCLTSCPATSPVIKIIDTIIQLYKCQMCSDSLCVQCNRDDYCEKCMRFTTNTNESIVLFNGKCLTQCPDSYVIIYDNMTDEFSCQVYIPPVIPVTPVIPQIIIPPEPQVKGMILQIQYPYLASYVSGGIFVFFGMVFLTLFLCSTRKALYFPFVTGLLALPQTFIIGYSLYYHFLYNYYRYFERLKFGVEFYILTISILIFLILNIINFGMFCRIFQKDISFQQWKNHNSCFSKVFYVVLMALSLVNFKFENIFWSKFSVFPILSQVEKLKPFTVISGISMIPIAGMIASYILLLPSEPQIKQIYYDGIAVLGFCSLINLFSLKRPSDLFVFQSVGQSVESQDMFDENSNMKINLHKRTFGSDNFFMHSIKPTAVYEQQVVNYRPNRYNGNETTQQLSSRVSISSSKSFKEMFSFSVISQQQEITDHKDKSNVFLMDVSGLGQRSILKDKGGYQIDQSKIYYKSQGGEYHQQTISELNTDQTTEREELNDAISEIDEGSERGEMGSVDDEVKIYQNQNGKKDEDKNIASKRKQLVEKLKRDADRMDLVIKSRQIQVNPQKREIIKPKQNNQILESKVLAEKVNEQVTNKEKDILDIVAFDVSKFLDISEIQKMKEQNMKIDYSDKALFEDSVILNRNIEIIDLSEVDNLSDCIKMDEKQRQSEEKEKTGKTINNSKNSNEIKRLQQSNYQNKSHYPSKLEAQGLDLEQDEEILDLNDIETVNLENNFEINNETINKEISDQDNYFQEYEDIIDNSFKQESNQKQNSANSKNIISQQNQSGSLQNNLSFYPSQKSDQNPLDEQQTQKGDEDDYDTILLDRNRFKTKEQFGELLKILIAKKRQQKQEIEKNQSKQSHFRSQQFQPYQQDQELPSKLQTTLNIKNQVKQSRLKISQEFIQNHNNAIQGIKSMAGIRNEQEPTKGYIQIQQVPSKSPPHFKHNFIRYPLQESIGIIQQFSIDEPGQDQNEENLNEAEQHNFQTQESKPVNDQPDFSSVVKQQSHDQLFKNNHSLLEDSSNSTEQNYFRIQTKIKSKKVIPSQRVNSHRKKQAQHLMQKRPKQQILIVEDKKFKVLKRKLKSIQKQEERQVKILRQIQQKRHIIQLPHPNLKNQYISLQTNRTSQINRLPTPNKTQSISGSKVNLIKQGQRPPRKRKSHLQLQSKLHVQKIYRNSITSLYRSNSSQFIKRHSQDKSKNKSLQGSKYSTQKEHSQGNIK